MIKFIRLLTFLLYLKPLVSDIVIGILFLAFILLFLFVIISVII